jgi:hypothetical protein
MRVSGNPIHELLDEAGVPWRLPRAALAERYGIRQHPAYQWKVIAIETAPPIVHGLMWPLDVQVRPQFSPAMPATHFSALTGISDDARENLRHCTEQLTPTLGEPEIADSSNTLGKRWAFGAASLSVIVWPPEQQPPELRLRGVNPAEDREPRLRTACHLNINTGWRAVASAEELQRLASFVPVGRIALEDRRVSARSAELLPAHEGELEFVREPVGHFAHLFGFVGFSADRATLIFWHRQLYLVPMADVIDFSVSRALPAKGSGGAKLYANCRTTYEDLATKRLLISEAPGADDLNDFAQSMSSATGKPFELGDYWYDA